MSEAISFKIFLQYQKTVLQSKASPQDKEFNHMYYLVLEIMGL